MIVAKIQVSGAIAHTLYKKVIPAGIIGAQIEFEYAEDIWQGLHKTVVFRGLVTKDVVTDANIVTIPPEVVEKPRSLLIVGVYGVDAEGNLAIPTVWADLGLVRESASPSGDTTTDPSLPVWAQLQGLIGNLEELDTEAKNNLVTAINEARTNLSDDVNQIKADLEKQRAVSNDIAESNVVWNAEKVTVSGSSAWTGSYIDTDISVKEGTTYYLHIDSVENCKSNVCAAFRLYKDGKSYFLTELTVSDVQNGNSVSITIGDYSDTYNIKVILYRNCSESVTEFGTTTFNGARVTTGSPDIKYQAKAKCKSYWDGKKIVWFGTSIPAGVYDYDETRNYYNKDTSYPRIVGSILGAFVFNEAVGSSAMHTRSASLITESNPYGYPADFEYSAKTFSDSLEMKEWLIAHYDDAYWQIQRWSTMTNEQKNSIRSWSWENKLNRYLTGGSVGPADLYVFDHGYNDPKDSESGHDYAANKAAYGEDNLYSFHGACNYLLRKIYSDNPNAKVVWISHYTRNYSETLKELYAMQKEVCEDWDIYLIPLCDKLGWSNKEVTVKGQWVKQPEGGYLWVEDGTERTITVKDANVPDGTHPALDKSGNSNIVIAEALASMINGLFKD